MPVTHAYVALGPCGHPIELLAEIEDREELSRMLAKLSGDAVRRGGCVERLTMEAARARALEMYSCPQCSPAPATEKD
jgi:hypothetical protein